MKGVVYEHQASAAIDTARALYRRLGDAVEAIEWAIVRDPQMGVALTTGDKRRMVVFAGGKSIGMPTIEVIFEETAKTIIIHDMEFR